MVSSTNLAGLLRRVPHRFVAAIVLPLLVALAGCDLSTPTTGPRATGQPTSTGLGASGSPTAEPSGFAFEAADVIAYYRSIGYTCADPKPSTVAARYTVTTCQLVDPAGRTRVVGMVTSAAGELGNGYAAVLGAGGEAYLDPANALEPLAAFLGTMLGETRGGDAAVWLKERLGAVFERTTIGPLTVATYTGPGDDPSRLYVEVADDAYLKAAPAPSP